MSFHYEKASEKSNDHGSWWTSYADLFMMLSIVFLLMFVASSLRSGSAGFSQQVEYQKLAKRAEDLEQQIKVYNTLKDESLKNANEAEQDVYNKLMGKLDLLKDDAHQERLTLEKKAKENADKEYALNQYQQMIRNIINTNVLAKTQISRRDNQIVVRDLTIEEKKKKIVEMEGVVAKNEAQIDDINSKLADKIKALHNEQAHSKMSKQVMEQKITVLRNQTEEKVHGLELQNDKIAVELGTVRGTLVETKAKLEDTTAKLEDTTQENTQLVDQLQNERVTYVTELNEQRRAHAAQLAAEKETFETNLNKERLTAAARAKKLAAFQAEAARKQAELEAGLNGLQGKIKDTESKLHGAEEALAGTQEKLQGTQAKLKGTQAKLHGTLAALEGTQAKLQGTEAKLEGTAAALEGTSAALQGTEAKLKGTQSALAGTQNKLAGTQAALQGAQSKLQGTEAELKGTANKLAGAEAEKGRALAAVEDLKGDLARTRAIANARKQLAKMIADNFGRAGLKGNVDGKTGEVTLDFGEEYFDTGSTALKDRMKTTLDKFIPVYTKSLFSDPKVADKIGNVEIIGFASSTYKGKYVNPKSVRAEDKDAIEYNLKLSFGRANSIFKHVLNQDKMSKEDREKLLPIIKVVGRGYLPDGANESELKAGMAEKDFCKRFNCNKAQRVIVKFNMKD